MQFALHYMFEEEARARHFFQLVAHHLRPGGSFIATTVDARVVIDMLAGLGVQDTGTNEWVARLVDEEQRELCRLAVDKETYDKIFRGDPAAPSPFCGLRYTFLLRDGTEEVSQVLIKTRTYFYDSTVIYIQPPLLTPSFIAST